MPASRWLALLVLVSASLSCSRSKAQHQSAEPDPRWVLMIDNHHWGDVNVAILRDGQRRRLGPVTAISRETFLLPEHMLGQGRVIRLEAGAAGGRRRVATERLVVRPGQQVEWTIERALERSSVAVW